MDTPLAPGATGAFADSAPPIAGLEAAARGVEPGGAALGSAQASIASARMQALDPVIAQGRLLQRIVVAPPASDAASASRSGKTGGRVFPSASRLATSSARTGTPTASSAPPLDATAAWRRLAPREGRDVVVLHLAEGGPPLVLSAVSARELLQAQGLARPALGRRSGAKIAPAALPQAALPSISVVDIIELALGQKQLGRALSRWIERQIEGEVAETLRVLVPAPGHAASAPEAVAPFDRALILLHGAFVDCDRTFADLLPGASLVTPATGTAVSGRVWSVDTNPLADWASAAASPVLAFDHRTLGRGPIANALALVQALPERDGDATQPLRLQFLTHSRGGLVAEILARVCADAQQGLQPTPQSDADRVVGGADAPEHRALVQLRRAVAARRVAVEQIVRVAAPQRGTPLAGPRLDLALNLVRWTLTLAGVPVAPALLRLITEVARRRVDARELPGLAALAPGNPLLRWLDEAPIATPPGPTPPSPTPPGSTPAPETRRLLLAGQFDAERPAEWVPQWLAGLFFQEQSDLVIPTASMLREPGGAAAGQPTRDRALTLQGSDAAHWSYFRSPRGLRALAGALREGRWPAPVPLQPLRTPLTQEHSAGLAAGGSAVDGTPSLTVQIVNGDLRFLEGPLLIGHYRAERFTGTEAVVDRAYAGRLEQARQLASYPRQHGDAMVYTPTQGAAAGPSAVVVIGLGDEGHLSAGELAASVRQGVLQWAMARGTPGVDRDASTLSAVLVGSGGQGMSAAQSAQMLVQGVQEANARLRERALAPLLRLDIVEIYHSRAHEAWVALRAVQPGLSGPVRLAARQRFLPGALRQPLHSGYRSASYDYIQVLTTHDAAGQPELSYTLDTRRARAEVRAVAPQVPLVRELIQAAAAGDPVDPRLGQTLFQLLVPLPIQPFLGASSEMLLELDAGSAPIPWELLQPPRSLVDDRPWALRSKVLRRLRVQDPLPPRDAPVDAHALVIGDPRVVDAQGRALQALEPLPQAQAEARIVAQLLRERGAADAMRGQVRRATRGGAVPRTPRARAAVANPDDPVRLLVGADAAQIIHTLYEQPWRVLHVAGHGRIDAASGADGQPTAFGDAASPAGGAAVIIGPGLVLGAAEVRQMRAVPELVFINTCHSGAWDARRVMRTHPQWAAGIATALIELGVRCVIAGGWALGDAAAAVFAERFYAALAQGRRFVDAVALARQATWEAEREEQDPGAPTWAAYQCYGDPDWQWRSPDNEGVVAAPLTASQDDDSEVPLDEFAEIDAPPALALALETIAVRATTLRTTRDADAARRARQLMDASTQSAGRPRDASTDDRASLRVDPLGPVLAFATAPDRLPAPDDPVPVRILRAQVLALERLHGQAYGGIGAVAEAWALAWAVIGDRDAARAWAVRATEAVDRSASLRAAVLLQRLGGVP